MSSVEPIDLYVDVEELLRILTELDGAHSRMLDLVHPRAAPLDAASVGSAELAQAVEGFLLHWRGVGNELATKLEAARDFARVAAREYDMTDRTLAREAADTGEKTT